jgi:hypothetical protein
LLKVASYLKAIFSQDDGLLQGEITIGSYITVFTIAGPTVIASGFASGSRHKSPDRNINEATLVMKLCMRLAAVCHIQSFFHCQCYVSRTY